MMLLQNLKLINSSLHNQQMFSKIQRHNKIQTFSILNPLNLQIQMKQEIHFYRQVNLVALTLIHFWIIRVMLQTKH